MTYRGIMTAPATGLRREIDRMFDDVFNGRASGGWAPPVDIRETRESLVFEADLPGLTADDIEVQTEHDLLTIRGQRAQLKETPAEARVHVVERVFGRFSRTFQLPQGYDVAKVEAAVTNGVLTIKVPKAAHAQPRTIPVKGANVVQSA
ncbi:MAG: Hsp20/alpha crystallin family protein [Gemmatimonadetes bacterium]|nr:Hsp20/alpha crystallin family protein [Gemmatimonadota bacterium]